MSPSPLKQLPLSQDDPSKYTAFRGTFSASRQGDSYAKLSGYFRSFVEVEITHSF